MRNRRVQSALSVALFGFLPLLTSFPAAGQNQTAQQVIAECHRQAAFQYDPGRKAAGVSMDNIDSAAAIEACRQAVRLDATWRIQYQYGRSLMADGQDGEALQWFRKAADQNSAVAQYGLGWMYANARGVAKDDEEAAK